MRRRLLAVALFFASCNGSLEGTYDDPGGGGDPDAAPAATLSIAGSVRDFFDDGPLAGATIAADGITPALQATSDATGAYAIDGLPAASVSLTASAPNYRATANPPLDMAAQPPGTPLAADVYVVSSVGAQRQASTLGLPNEPGTSLVVAELRNGQGLPKEGIPLAQITLTDAAGAPAGDGPYFLGALGDVDPALAVSTAYDGHARVAFVNVPAGELTLSVLYQVPTDGGGTGTGTPIDEPVTSAADSAELLLFTGGGGGGGGGGM